MSLTYKDFLILVSVSELLNVMNFKEIMLVQCSIPQELLEKESSDLTTNL